ncbi:MAG: N-6 DNA methylase [Verrucomicrobia bacterium]|nr:N-6 DNA methylase [Verrucomicrobiota bacterium]
MAEITEWTFAADAAMWMTLYLQGHKQLPFAEAKVEIKGKENQSRRDLVLFDRDGRKALTAEIKLPDTREGQTPYNAGLIADARRKAAQSHAPYFATWNVNRLVLWPTDQEHELKVYDVATVRQRGDLAAVQVQRRIREEFIPRFLEEFARIYRGEEALGVLPMDQRFIRRLESALESLANVIFPAALDRYVTHRPFKQGLDTWMREQEWLLSDDDEMVRENVERAIRLACYITANKLVFYQALRRTRTFKLPKLAIPPHTDTAERLRDHFAALFHQAKEVTHDYQTIFEGGFIDRVPFITDHAVERWRLLVELLNEFDFRQFDQDLIGHIFEGLLGPEERHRWGQHYTKPEVADLINAFCIRRHDAVALDPSSGSGTFAVRAYARKKHLARGALTHADLLSQVYACEISEYAAHLTALNLATRDLIDGENFPRVARADFFDTSCDKPFCSVPDVLAERKKRADIAMRDIALTRADAVVGNPPYLREKEIGRTNKQKYLQQVCAEWPSLTLSGRSDLHVYFWPHACALLPEGGYFGFLTSSPWLDADYGFQLQRWILQNFEIIAILESVREPWFTGARVATAATILRRCSDSAKRAANLVRFVQLRKPLKELLANDGTETGRQEAAERLRDLIENTKADTRTPDYRILVVPQQKLWDDGCQAGELTDTGESEDNDTQPVQQTNGMLQETGGDYHAARPYPLLSNWTGHEEGSG